MLLLMLCIKSSAKKSTKFETGRIVDTLISRWVLQWSNSKLKVYTKCIKQCLALNYFITWQSGTHDLSSILAFVQVGDSNSTANNWRRLESPSLTLLRAQHPYYLSMRLQRKLHSDNFKRKHCAHPTKPQHSETHSLILKPRVSLCTTLNGPRKLP